MISPDTLELDSLTKLMLVRRLDRSHNWRSLNDRRLCLVCGRLMAGRDVVVHHSIWGLGLLRLKCPTPDCRSGPRDWIAPDVNGVTELASGHRTTTEFK